MKTLGAICGNRRGATVGYWESNVIPLHMRTITGSRVENELKNREEMVTVV